MTISKKLYWLLFFICFTGSIILFYIMFSYSKTALLDTQIKQINSEYDFIQKQISIFKINKDHILTMLKEHEDLQTYLNNPSHNKKIRVQKLFFNQAKSDPYIMQIRLLNFDGQELVKIDKNNHKDTVKIIDDNKLQNKANRDYFQIFNNLKKDEIAFSKLDLNKEFGKVESPQRETIRMGLPITIDNHKYIIIVNYYMGDWIKNVFNSSVVDIYLIDSQGYFVLHPDKTKNWSKYLSKPFAVKDDSLLKNINLLEKQIIDKNIIIRTLSMFNNQNNRIVFKIKDELTLKMHNQIKTIGILIFIGLLLPILPFIKIISNYINHIKNDKEQTQKREKRINTILNNTFDSIIIFDHNGIIRQTNAATKTIFGYEDIELIGKDVKILVPDQKFNTMNYKAQFHTINKQKDLFGLKKDAQHVPINVVITKMKYENELFYIGTVRNISKEIQNKAMFETMFNTSPLGMALVLDDGSFSNINDSFCEIIGYEHDKIINLTFQYITHNDDLEKDLFVLNQLIKKEIKTYHLLKRYIHKKGHVVWVNLTVSAVFEEEDTSKVKFFIAIVEDRTEMIQMQKKEKEQQLLLMQQSKLASMGEMVTAIAHQWRQPLNSIGITMQDLVYAFKDNELDEKYLHESKDEIMQQLHLMSDTIDEFRNFFTKNNSITKFDLYSAIDEVIKLSWAQFTVHNINIETTCKENEIINNLADAHKKIVLKGSPSDLKQVILNLLNNAKDAILSLKSQNNLQNTIKLIVDIHETHINIKIYDLAGGIDKTAASRVFEPYFTTKEMGTGLGLYICKTLLEHTFNATIQYESYTNESLKGSCFNIEIPESNII